MARLPWSASTFGRRSRGSMPSISSGTRGTMRSSQRRIARGARRRIVDRHVDRGARCREKAGGRQVHQRGVPAAHARARGHGASEHNGVGDRRKMPNLGRYPGSDPLRDGGIQNYRFAGGQGRAAQPIPGRRIGRRLETDSVEQAVNFAKQVAYPLKVIWTREEDIRHDVVRPMYHDRISAVLDSAGTPVWYGDRIAGATVRARWAPGTLGTDGLDGDLVECAAEIPYDVPDRKVEWVRHDMPEGISPDGGAGPEPRIICSWWRASWMNWRMRRIRIRSNTGVRCCGKIPAPWRCSILPRKKSVGAQVRCPRGWGGVSHWASLRKPRLRDRRGGSYAAGRSASAPRGGGARLRHRDQSRFGGSSGPRRSAIRLECRAV